MQGVEIQQNAARDAAMLEFLSQFITDERKQRFEEVLDYRTRHITVVLEDIFQPHNASAVMRSCDLMGVQDVHVVENNNHYDVNPEVVMGSTKWLNLNYYESSEFNTPAALNACTPWATRSWPHVRIATTSRPTLCRSTSLLPWSLAPRRRAFLIMPSNMPTCMSISRCTASRRVSTSASRRLCCSRRSPKGYMLLPISTGTSPRKSVMRCVYYGQDVH